MPERYSIADLCERFGVSKHSIYAYTKTGAMSPPLGGKKYAFYTDEHVKQIEDVQNRRKAWLRGAPVSVGRKRRFSSKTRAIVWERSGGSCHYCRKILNPFIDFSIDHIVPVSAGGTEELSNFVACCRNCNSVKGKKPYASMVTATHILDTTSNFNINE